MSFNTANNPPTIAKDPSAELDYAIDWSAWLAGDTLADVTWQLAEGLVAVQDSHTDTVATIWIEGGEARRSYTATCHVVTAGGREDSRSFVLQIGSR